MTQAHWIIVCIIAVVAAYAVWLNCRNPKLPGDRP